MNPVRSLVTASSRQFVVTSATAFALCTLSPLAAGAAITAVTDVTQPMHTFYGCPTSATFNATVTGTPGEKFTWIVNYELDGASGNTGSAPVSVTLPAAAHAATAAATTSVPVTYTLNLTPGHAHFGKLQFTVQSGQPLVNSNSAPMPFSFDCLTPQLAPVTPVTPAAPASPAA